MSVLSPEVLTEKVATLEKWTCGHEEKHDKEEAKLDVHFDTLYKKIDRLLYWLMGVMAMALIAVLAMLLKGA